MSGEGQPVFLFENREPSRVLIYRDLDWARGLLEGLDAATFREQGFTAAGQVVMVAATADLFARFELTDRVDLEQLKNLLRRVDGPQQLADDPAAYAEEWLRLDDLDARRPPFVPRRLCDWYRERFPGRGADAVWRA